MKYFILLFLVSCIFPVSMAQVTGGYSDSIKAYQKAYVLQHEVVKGKNKKKMHFYPPDISYKTIASVERIEDSTLERMKTSGTIQKDFYRYAYLHFTLGNEQLRLTLYKSVKSNTGYEDHLFLPFTDKSSGEKSYAGGRYLDFSFSDIKTGKLEIDFNKAYNPYCAYASGYNCPVPPAENNLTVYILAGEKDYKK